MRTPHLETPRLTESDDAQESYTLPCAEAMLAATLALMTGHAQSCCDDHRALMTHKVLQHLQLLARHPVLSADFRSLLAGLHVRWQIQCERQRQQVLARAQASRHAAPSTLQ